MKFVHEVHTVVSTSDCGARGFGIDPALQTVFVVHETNGDTQLWTQPAHLLLC